MGILNEYCPRLGRVQVTTYSLQQLRWQATSSPAQNVTSPKSGRSRKSPLGKLAQQKEEDKQFFADLLSAAATKRDAKAYLSRLKSDRFNAKPDLSGIFFPTNAVADTPKFEQNALSKSSEIQYAELPHVALVKISAMSQIDDGVLRGIAGTLTQLARLSMLPCIVIDEDTELSPIQRRKQVEQQADRLVSAIEDSAGYSVRKVSDILSIGSDGRAMVTMPALLERPLQRGRIVLVMPVAYDPATQSITSVKGDDVLVALTKYSTGHESSSWSGGVNTTSTSPKAAVIDRVIVIDAAGGVPSTKSIDQMHVFVNMEQEYHSLQEELRSSNDDRVSPSHASNLSMLRQCLQLLPSTASGLITTPFEAANSCQRAHDSPPDVSTVGTRRQRNPLIHSLLTDKPAYSSSLPSSRLSTEFPVLTTSTSVKHGLPLTILPNPDAQQWTPTKKPWIQLTDPRIDLDRLVYLINDSFGRQLDVPAYLRRVNDTIAGVIIAGDYEGGAILTWERPSYLPSDSDRLVPYLDKFAVLRKAQGGGGGVADILFNAMTRTCFPDGVCWRSRKNNPVNKWYFERSRGTWKLPGMDWTMFWTTPNVVAPGVRSPNRGGVSNQDTFLDYETVCRSVQPTWLDKKAAA
ncbi:Amino-acid acetyltransferase, mitochondrial [Cyphellophora attinorum]|uniref:Amino-acid acetyltransferase, mitochondrial n=1 Tax=Cyphellophora attinorum TaxID=1664694 RepID=A0A0N0NQM1_9EURO|nr:Amino-acid acetyltransferase, mitochondrial [Phialophora attinorum]KPI44068.1 Amino-acid acetyltransferase, mitochondrial [Phialophora attinorum]